VIGHWGLQRDPFTGLDSPYVSMPSHDEAVKRLVHAIESSQSRATLIAPAGLGKSVVLREAFRRARNLKRRFVSVNCQRDGALPAVLAERLGQRIGREPGRLTAWRALDRALRISSLQGIQFVVAIEVFDGTPRASEERDVVSLERMGAGLHPRLTLIQLARSEPDRQSETDDPGRLAIGLAALTRSQTEHFLLAKLNGAGGGAQIFTPRAITRLHALSAGVPRSVEQLATACLAAGAMRGLEILPPDLVDEVTREYSADLIGTGHLR
jgi:type II secretory pathway predicted ATPase ExeA